MTVRADGATYYSEGILFDVLSNLALEAVRGQDGRSLNAHALGQLVTLARVARDLSLPSAALFAQVLAIAEKGCTRDLERAVLTVLTSPVKESERG